MSAAGDKTKEAGAARERGRPARTGASREGGVSVARASEGDADPQGPDGACAGGTLALPGWGGRASAFLLGGLFLLYLLFFPDKRTDELLTRVSWVLLAVAALTDREGPLRARLRLLAILYPATLLAAAPALLAHDQAGAALRFFFRYQDWLLWLTVLWLATPHLLQFARRHRTVPCLCLPSMTAALLLFDLLVMASALGTPDSKISMKQLGAGALPYSGLFLVMVRLLPAATRGRVARLRQGALAVTGLVLAAMLGVVVVHAAGGPAAEWLREHQWIRVETDPSAPKRLQFPFEHHNRAGYFAACALLFSAAAAAIATAARRERLAALGLAALALLVLPFPMTRGAILAAAVGGAAAAAGAVIMRGRRFAKALWLLPAILPFVWFVLPEAHRRHFTSTFSARTVDPNEMNTVVSRFTLWRYTAEMIAERPMLGFGYGFENFEQRLKEKYPAQAAALDGSSHAHNLWLEIAAESGLPAAAAFLLFTLLRFNVLVQGWRTARRTGHPLALALLVWMGLEIAIQIYALTNHPLRRNIGYFTWAQWAVGTALAGRALQGREGKRGF